MTDTSESNFVYVLRPTRVAMLAEGPTDHEQQVVGEHVQYLEDLAAQGVVELAGRSSTDDESTFGIVLFSAPDEDGARQVMRGDPAVRNNVMSAQLFPFRVAVRS